MEGGCQEMTRIRRPLPFTEGNGGGRKRCLYRRGKGVREKKRIVE